MSDIIENDAINAKFSIGQIVRHSQYGYRGVVVDVDPLFDGTDELYDAVSNTEPARNEPWYHVLVDEDDIQTYVSEQLLLLDWEDEPIDHPYLDVFFSDFDVDHYVSRQSIN